MKNPSAFSHLKSLKLGFLKTLCCAAMALLLLTTRATAALILWDAAPSTVNVNDATQVSTQGTLFTAVSYWSTDTAVVNTVTFANFGTASHFTPFTPISGSGSGGYTPTNEYGKLIAYGAFLTSASDISNPSVFSGLTVGHQYQLQIWVPVWNSPWPTQFGPDSNGSNINPHNSPTLTMAISPSTATQYIFGTFTADATTQNLYQFAQSSYSGFSALQLRDVTPVPEPQTWTLAFLGASAVLFRLRRKARNA